MISGWVQKVTQHRGAIQSLFAIIFVGSEKFRGQNCEVRTGKNHVPDHQGALGEQQQHNLQVAMRRGEMERSPSCRKRILDARTISHKFFHFCFEKEGGGGI